MPPTSTSTWRLTIFPQRPPNLPLPPNIIRSFIPTQSGNLELLSSLPSTTSHKTPLLFLHGGFGNASEYSNLLTHFSSSHHPSYSLSLRGHGHSWQPSFLRLCFLTPSSALLEDIAAGIAAVRERHPDLPPPVLVAHSNGGGLAQKVLDTGMTKTSGLVLLSGTPNYGGLSVYKRWWFEVDKWFLPRMYFWHFGHMRSPLSSTQLVRNAFFSKACPEDVVRRCELGLAEYENLRWPMGMMNRFVECGKVLEGCMRRVLVVAADEDVLMSVGDMRRMAAEYKEAAGKGGQVGLDVVNGSGHAIQVDVKWEGAARLIERWLEENVD